MSNSSLPPPADRDVAALITAGRLRSYLADCHGDLAAAVRLYHWNLDVASAVISLAAMVEVSVRNLMDANLVAWANSRHGGASWLDAVRLDRQGANDLVKARARATKRGKIPEMHGKVVAELNFGFWRYLLAKRYYTDLWLPALQHTFPAAPGNSPDERRAAVERLMENLMFVRNRAAHHEPIHRRNLLHDQRDAELLASWTQTAAQAWIQYRSPLPRVVATRPPAA